MLYGDNTYVIDAYCLWLCWVFFKGKLDQDEFEFSDEAEG